MPHDLTFRCPHGFMRLLACALAPLVLVAFAPPVEPIPPVPAGGDRVYGLAGTWACRAVEGAIVHSTGVREGDTVKVHDDVDDAGKRASFEDRYVFDAAQHRWHVASDLGGLHGDASPWLDGTWTIQGEDANHVRRRMVLEPLPNGDFRRTLSYEDGPGPFVVLSAERCAAGTTPPPADACIAERYPAATLEAPEPDARFVPNNERRGLVQVVVSLNERSEIVGTRIQTSPFDSLNKPSLDAARAAKFRTAIVNCKPIAADYIFSVRFTR